MIMFTFEGINKNYVMQKYETTFSVRIGLFDEEANDQKLSEMGNFLY